MWWRRCQRSRVVLLESLSTRLVQSHCSEGERGWEGNETMKKIGMNNAGFRLRDWVLLALAASGYLLIALTR